MNTFINVKKFFAKCGAMNKYVNRYFFNKKKLKKFTNKN